MYDIIIIGGGTAGLSAAIYCARSERSVLVLEKTVFGGQILNAEDVENYPSVAHISGYDFANALLSQAKKAGAVCRIENVSEIRSGNVLKVFTNKGEHECRKIIIATGARPRLLGVPGEARLTGRGVSYCALCDGAFFKGKNVCVIGGGNSALYDALHLSKICNTVYLIHRRKDYRAEKIAIKAIEGRKNIVPLLETTVSEIIGEDKVCGVVLKSGADESEKTLEVSGVFCAIGHTPDNKPFSNIIKLDEYGFALSDENGKTDSENIYVAGDCRKKAVYQLATAAADGVCAAVSAVRALEK